MSILARLDELATGRSEESRLAREAADLIRGMSPIAKFVGKYPHGVINPEYVEQLEKFFRKYAVGDLTVPSCFGCGQLTTEPKTKHLELHGIVLCDHCSDAINSAPSGEGGK